MTASEMHQGPRLDDAVELHLRTDFTPLNVDQTIGQALEQIRSRQQGGRIIYFYVVDDDGRLQGVVPTRLLLLSPLDRKLSDVMIRKVLTIPRTATVMDACEIFVLHKFLALPVVDEEKRLVGVVDIELYTDEITDLAQRTGYDDLFQIIGLRTLSADKGSPVEAFRQRFPWLICNIAGGILCAILTGQFQETLDRLIVLALFIPVVLTLSESVGIQSVSLAIQALHEPELGWRKILETLRRELKIGLMLGLASGPLVGLAAWLWKGQATVASTILISISLAMTAAALIGMALPLILHVFHRDPRVAAGPVALLLTDLTTLFVYFGLSTLFLT